MEKSIYARINKFQLEINGEIIIAGIKKIVAVITLKIRIFKNNFPSRGESEINLMELANNPRLAATAKKREYSTIQAYLPYTSFGKKFVSFLVIIMAIKSWMIFPIYWTMVDQAICLEAILKFKERPR